MEDCRDDEVGNFDYDEDEGERRQVGLDEVKEKAQKILFSVLHNGKDK